MWKVENTNCLKPKKRKILRLLFGLAKARLYPKSINNLTCQHIAQWGEEMGRFVLFHESLFLCEIHLRARFQNSNMNHSGKIIIQTEREKEMKRNNAVIAKYPLTPMMVLAHCFCKCLTESLIPHRHVRKLFVYRLPMQYLMH